MSASEEPLDLLKTNYGPFCSSHEEFSKKIQKNTFWPLWIFPWAKLGNDPFQSDAFRAKMATENIISMAIDGQNPTDRAGREFH